MARRGGTAVTVELPSFEQNRHLSSPRSSSQPLSVFTAEEHEKQRVPPEQLPPPNLPSYEPLPNKSHQDAKRSRRQAQGGKFPARSQARLAQHLPHTHCCPPARGAATVPLSPALPSAPGRFFQTQNLPGLPNKPPSSSKPAAFLTGKAVKGSPGRWERQRGKNEPRTQSPHLQELKGLLGFGFFFPSGCNIRAKS